MSKDAPVTQHGYYRFPTIAKDQVVFVSEDDLWTVESRGGIARRLSSGLGKARSPQLSHDGKWIAFTSSEEGHGEIFVMPSAGGEARRLTFLGADARPIGWTRKNEIIFASHHEQAFARLTDIYTLELKFGDIRKIPCGPATHLDFDSRGRMVIARHGGVDLAYWKRYRGGTAGEIWVERKGKGQFTKLLKESANSARPYWIGNRIFFISDHDGIGQVYSVREDGSDLKRHSESREFYARGLNVSGSQLVYHAGGDLFVMDTKKDKKPRRLTIDYRSPRTQTNRRFVAAPRYLEDYELHPSGEKAVISVRGKTFSFDLWKGPVLMHGPESSEVSSVRYRSGRFLKDGKRIALLSDSGGEEALEIHDAINRGAMDRFTGLDLGRTVDMKLSPVADEALISNHRNELIWVDLAGRKSRVLDRSLFAPIGGFNWSPDGRWVAYGCSENERQMAIRICEIKSGKVHRVTRPVLVDEKPCFDPLGEYLYFLSYREFDPVYDNLHFDLGFPRGCRPHLISLRKGLVSPFSSDHPGRANEKDKKEGAKDGADVAIDFDGIEDRMIAFPVVDGRYGQIAATREKIYFTRLLIKGSLRSDWRPAEPEQDAQLEMFDLESERTEVLVTNLTSFRVSHDMKHIIYRAGNQLRVIKTGEKPSRETDDYKRGGWLDLERVQIPVHPQREWRQIYREAWRLQRDHFWTEDMSRVDWVRVYKRYMPLLERVSARSEVSDVIWEMQGELGTSHAYESGGDYRPDPYYGIGFLGAEMTFESKQNAYRLTRVMKGDIWDETCSSPLARPGLELEPGDFIVAIDGEPLTRSHRPSQALVHRAGKEVSISFRRKGSKPSESETRAVKTLRSEQYLRYREWVDANRQWVHERSKGRVGYLHIPNMGPFGFAEFHRAFLSEIDREALIIDVRFNGGGHVSQLLLEKLARRRIGYMKSRWFGAYPYPTESPQGPMVALTNEYAGSDGDIFSHSFKLLKLGPLIGKRTWGGVIGINPRHSLVDGGYTTQPEYSYWFSDVGWQVENYGTDPDLEVEFLPSDYVSGRDPQLEAGLEACWRRISEEPSRKPRFGHLPDLSLP